MDYEKDLEIDAEALDLEWMNQPKLAMQYIEHYAKAVEKVALLEEEKKVIKAEQTAMINETPEEYLGDKVKPTVANIEAAIQMSDEYKNIKKKIIKARFELEIADGAKSQIAVTRKHSLENLVKLHGQNYFAGPSVPRDLSEEYIKNKRQSRTDEGIAKKMRRKRK